MNGAAPRAALPPAAARRPLWHVGCSLFTGAALAAGDPVGAVVGVILLAAPLVRDRRPGAAAAAAILAAAAVLAGGAAAALALDGLKQAPASLAKAFPGGLPIQGRVQAVERSSRGLRLLLSVPGVGGRVAVQWPGGPPDPGRWPLPGDLASVTPAAAPEAPRAARNPYGFDARRYWYARHVGVLVEARRVEVTPGPWSPRRALDAWRHRRLARLRQALPPEAAGLLEALLFGARGGLDQGLEDAFREAGVSHLLAVSGLHVGLVAAGLGRLVAWCGLAGPARWALTAAGAALYAALAGAGAPVNRAAVGAALLGAAPLLGRPVDPLNLLGAAACWALATRPLAALDLSFRMSFLAVTGMVLLAGRLEALLVGVPRFLQGAARGLAGGTAAQLALAPLLAASFGHLAWAGAPATVIVLPPFALLLGAGGAWALLDAACRACADPLIPALEGAAWLVARLGQWLAAAGGVWSAPSPPGWWAVLYYAWLLGWAGDWRAPVERLRRREPGLPRRLLAAALGLAVLLVWGTAALVPRRLEVVFLDVGQGDAIAVGAPGGAWAAVDTGRTGRELAAFLRARGVRRLHWWAVSHFDADHAGGMDLLARLYPGALLVTPEGDGAALPAVDGAWSAAAGGGRPHLAAGRGDRLRLGPVPVHVLGPPAGALAAGWSENDRSLVLRVDWAGWRVLLAGDIEAAAEASLLEAGLSLQADVLKVAHHGSDTSTSAAWLAQVRPRVAVISVGRRNGYGHPHGPVLQRLHDAGSVVVRTDLHGAVWMRLDPRGLDVTYYGPDGPRRFRLPAGQDRGDAGRREEAWSITRLSAAWSGANRRPFTWSPGPRVTWSGPSWTGCGRWPASRPSTSRSLMPPITACRRCWRPPGNCPCSGRAASWWPPPTRGWAAAGGAWAPATWRTWRPTPPIRRRRPRWCSWRRSPTGA